MKNYLLLITLFTIMFSLSMTCYLYVTAQYILAPVFLFSYIIVSIKFLKPKEFRMNKLKFLAVPTLLITAFSIFFFSATLFFCSLLGSYVVSVAIKNWLKQKLVKD